MVDPKPAHPKKLLGQRVLAMVEHLGRNVLGVRGLEN